MIAAGGDLQLGRVADAAELILGPDGVHWPQPVNSSRAGVIWPVMTVPFSCLCAVLLGNHALVITRGCSAAGSGECRGATGRGPAAMQVRGRDQAEHNQHAGGERDGPGSQRRMDIRGQGP